MKSLDFKRGFDLRGDFSLEAAQQIPRKKVRAQRGPQGVFPKMRFPENDFDLFRAAGAKLSRGALCGWGRKFFVALGGGMFYNVSIIGAGGNCDG